MPAPRPGYYHGKARIFLDAVFGMAALLFVSFNLFPGKASAASPGSGGSWPAGVLFLAASMFFFVSACRGWAVLKGYPRSYSWFGLLSVIGFVIVMFLPDRTRPDS
jgi:hypothetical protein